MTAQVQVWRIFANSLPVVGEHLVLEDDEHHYVRNVLRLRVGEIAEITDCCGGLATATLIKSEKRFSEFCIEKIKFIPKPERHVILFVGVPKPSALEELISVNTELGALEIHLVYTQKVQNKQELRDDRLKKIMRESLRVSRSVWETQIFVHASLEKGIADIPQNTIRYLCDESPLYEEHGTMYNHLLVCLNKECCCKSVVIFVGPEASFTNSERTLIRDKAGAISVTLGNNILRVPTAAASATSICLSYFTIRECT